MFISPSLSMPPSINRASGFALTQAVKQPEKPVEPYWQPQIKQYIFVTNTVGIFPFEADLAQIEKLRDGWHGHNSLGVDGLTMSRAREVLSLSTRSKFPSPEITPNPNGTVTLEWESDRARVLLEIGKTRIGGFIEAPQIGTLTLPIMPQATLGLISTLGEILMPSFTGKALTHAVNAQEASQVIAA